MRAEIFAEVDGVFDAIADLQAAIDRWVQYYNTARPHQSLGMVAPAARFALAAGPDLSVVEPVAAVPAEGQHPGAPVDLRDAGVRRWVNRHGSISVAGFRYRVPIVLAGEPVSVVVADNLVSIYHHDVLVASHVQHRKTDNTTGVVRQGRRTARPVTSGIVVTRVVDSNGDVSFAGTMYRAGRVWRGKQVEVSIVAESVQIACAGAIVRTHAIRHDRAKEHGAFATPHGRPRKPRQDAPEGPGVKATPLRGRPEGRALTPAP
ncbi:transposase [Mycobacterium shottsii]|nr:transposase [Mycobacterium shottsii]QYL28490.1 transposase [Mycobacterium shottsii]QYL30109.1 transposase [Mycobacterium shottsii]BBX56973.1 hypothetical protein MSHO_23180 [Mycobacterium shottsii]BBX58467.1 hypothetical protein MSHO_38120 [Mycobacterium shottsii]